VQKIWYGDRRDRVKWGALFYWAQREGIQVIAQIAFYGASRHVNLDVCIPCKEIQHPPINEQVLEHFSDLNHIAAPDAAAPGGRE
jgi:hypothetical protein